MIAFSLSETHIELSLKSEHVVRESEINILLSCMLATKIFIYFKNKSHRPTNTHLTIMLINCKEKKRKERQASWLNMF